MSFSRGGVRILARQLGAGTGMAGLDAPPRALRERENHRDRTPPMRSSS